MKQRSRYLLSHRSSLHYALPGRQWENLRGRVRQAQPGCEVCACRNGRPANQLHEQWSICRHRHTKRLTGLKFLCARCHGVTNEGWWPVERFALRDLQQEPVAISEKADPLLRKTYSFRTGSFTSREGYLQAVVRLGRLLEDVARGTVRLEPYRINLRKLRLYSSTTEEIAEFEKRTRAKAESDIRALSARLRGQEGAVLLFEHDHWYEERYRDRIAFSLPGTGLFTP